MTLKSHKGRSNAALWKVRALLNRVQQGCFNLLRPSKTLEDEQMIPVMGLRPPWRFVAGKSNAITSEPSLIHYFVSIMHFGNHYFGSSKAGMSDSEF